MSRAVNSGSKMPVGGSFTINNNPTGKPESQSSITYGDDLRTRGKGKGGK
jgi:hypothetical protein